MIVPESRRDQNPTCGRFDGGIDFSVKLGMSARALPNLSIRTLNRAACGINSKTKAVHNYSNTRYGSNPFDFLSYLAREQLRDLDTGKLCKGTKKDDLLDAYVVPPKGCGWAANIQAFANEISEADKRKNSRFGRELVLVCPDGMKPETFMAVLRVFNFWLSTIYNTAPIVCIHDPKGKQMDEPPETGRNLHAHVFLPTREVHPWGMGNKLYCLDYGKLAKKEVEGIREHWARELERGFAMQNETVEFDHRSYVRRGIERLPQPKIGSVAYSMDARGLHSFRIEEKEAVDLHNGYLDEAEKVLERVDTNIKTLEKLDAQELIGTNCLKVKSVWTGSERRERYDLNINNTLEFIEKLNAETEVFDDLIDDLLLLKKRCREEIDYAPVIEDIPKDTTVDDLYMIISQQLSEYGMKSYGRSRSRSREVEKAVTAGYSGIER